MRQTAGKTLLDMEIWHIRYKIYVCYCEWKCCSGDISWKFENEDDNNRVPASYEDFKKDLEYRTAEHAGAAGAITEWATEPADGESEGSGPPAPTGAAEDASALAGALAENLAEQAYAQINEQEEQQWEKQDEQAKENAKKDCKKSCSN
jgi:hypothetical protein